MIAAANQPPGRKRGRPSKASLEAAAVTSTKPTKAPLFETVMREVPARKPSPFKGSANKVKQEFTKLAEFAKPVADANVKPYTAIKAGEPVEVTARAAAAEVPALTAVFTAFRELMKACAKVTLKLTNVNGEIQVDAVLTPTEAVTPAVVEAVPVEAAPVATEAPRVITEAQGFFSEAAPGELVPERVFTLEPEVLEPAPEPAPAPTSFTAAVSLPVPPAPVVPDAALDEAFAKAKAELAHYQAQLEARNQAPLVAPVAPPALTWTELQPYLIANAPDLGNAS